MGIAFEATYGCSWFADLLADAGIAAKLAPPLATRDIAPAEAHRSPSAGGTVVAEMTFGSGAPDGHWSRLNASPG